MLTMEVAPGKYMVSGAFFPGYGRSSANIPQAYNNAIRQVKEGKAELYTPTAKSTRAPKSTKATRARRGRPPKATTASKPQKSQVTAADRRARQVQALRFQVNSMRARGMSDAQIRASLRQTAGSLLSQVL